MSSPDPTEIALARSCSSAAAAPSSSPARASAPSSGIPDFRSPGGVWSRMQPIYFQEFIASEEKRREAWRRRFDNRDGWVGAQPNSGHYAVAQLIAAGKASAVITQNVDNLHQASGVPEDKVIELHGNATYARCLGCALRIELAEIEREFQASGTVGPCRACGGIVKSATISFGQPMPAAADAARARSRRWRATCSSCSARRCRCFRPRTSRCARSATARALVIVNRDPTEMDELADLVIHAGIGATLGAATARLVSIRTRSFFPYCSNSGVCCERQSPPVALDEQHRQVSLRGQRQAVARTEDVQCSRPAVGLRRRGRDDDDRARRAIERPAGPRIDRVGVAAAVALVVVAIFAGSRNRRVVERHAAIRRALAYPPVARCRCATARRCALRPRARISPPISIMKFSICCARSRSASRSTANPGAMPLRSSESVATSLRSAGGSIRTWSLRYPTVASICAICSASGNTFGSPAGTEAPRRDQRRDCDIEGASGRVADIERRLHDSREIGGNVVPIRRRARIEARNFRIAAIARHRSVDLRRERRRSLRAHAAGSTEARRQLRL